MTGPTFAPVDDDTADLLGLIADDPRVEADYQRFLVLCELTARWNDGLVYVNKVRAMLTDDNGDLMVNPRRLSAFWAKATGHGKPMLKVLDEDGEQVWQVCKGSGSGNDGRPQPVRRWVA